MNQQLMRGPIKRLIRGIGRRWKQRRRPESGKCCSGWRAASDQIPTFSDSGPSSRLVAGAAIDGLVEIPSRRMTASKFAVGLLCAHRGQWIIDHREPRPLLQMAAKRRITGSAWRAILGGFRNSRLMRARNWRLTAA